MRLTTKGRFAVTAMIDVAMHGTKGPVTLADLSRHVGLSSFHLQRLFKRATGLSPRLGAHLPEPFVEVHPHAARAQVRHVQRAPGRRRGPRVRAGVPQRRDRDHAGRSPPGARGRAGRRRRRPGGAAGLRAGGRSGGSGGARRTEPAHTCITSFSLAATISSSSTSLEIPAAW